MSSPTTGVQSIERAFAVLGALGDGPLGVTDVADRARLPKSTAARLLGALAGEGAVEQVPGETPLPARAAPCALASGLGDTVGFVAIARPTSSTWRRSSARRPGCRSPTAGLVHYVDQVESPNPVQVRDWTGTRIPMHAVSLRARSSWPTRRAARRGVPRGALERFTPRTLTDPVRSASACGTCSATAMPGSATSSPTASPPWPRASPMDRRGRRGGPRPRPVVPLPAGRSRCRRGSPRRHDRGADRANAAPGGGVTGGEARDQWARRSLSRATPRRWPFSRYASLAAAHR